MEAMNIHIMLDVIYMPMVRFGHVLWYRLGVAFTNFTPVGGQCEHGHVCSSDKMCIAVDFICDTHTDCADGSDEYGCDGMENTHG